MGEFKFYMLHQDLVNLHIWNMHLHRKGTNKIKVVLCYTFQNSHLLFVHERRRISFWLCSGKIGDTKWNKLYWLLKFVVWFCTWQLTVEVQAGNIMSLCVFPKRRVSAIDIFVGWKIQFHFDLDNLLDRIQISNKLSLKNCWYYHICFF